MGKYWIGQRRFRYVRDSLLVLCLCLCACDRGLRKENERLREELALQQRYVPLERDTIRDSVVVVTQKVVEVEKVKEVLSAEERQLLKDLGMKGKDVESLQTIGGETSGEVGLEACYGGEMLEAVPPGTHNLGGGSGKEARDSVLRYRDAWVEFEIEGRRLRYQVKDSLAIAVKRAYKHRFLWWKWKVKGYEVKVVNFNPNARIRYHGFVKKEKSCGLM